MSYDILLDERFAEMLEASARASRTPAIRNMAAVLGSLHPDTAGAAALLLAVQKVLRYTPTDQWRWPTDAVVAGEGDCKDGSVLLASLFQARGWPVRLVAYGHLTPSHVVVQVFVDGAWRWAETTVPAQLGEEPWAAYQRTRGTTVRADLEGPRATLGAMPAARHAAARDIVDAAWRAQLGRAPTTFERQLVQGVALTETSYGRGWGSTCGGACASSNNWGAIQATGSQSSCPCSDSHQDGTRYNQGFRTYARDDAAARDLVRHMTSLRPMTAAALARGASVEDVARAMYLEHYFGAGCPNAIKKYGPGTHKQSSLYTQGGATTEAGLACDDEAVAMYAKKLSNNVSDLAKALGESPPPATGSGGSILPLLLVAGGVGGALWWAHRRGML